MNDPSITAFLLAILALPAFLYWRFRYGNSSYGGGYSSEGKMYSPHITKGFGQVVVKFYNWGGPGDTIDGKSTPTPDGIYAIVSSPWAIQLDHSRPLFDEVTLDTEKRFVATLKKRGVFMGKPEMKEFLERFDVEFWKDVRESSRQKKAI